MKKNELAIFFVALIIGAGNSLYAQGILNQGAAIRVEPNGVLHVEGKITNNANSQVTVYGGLVLTGELVNNGTLNIESGGIMLDNGISGTGTSVVKQKVTGAKTHYTSQPIAAANTSVFTGGFAGSWNEPSSGWVPLNTGELSIMQGYSVYFTSDKTIEFNGTTNTGNQSLTLSASGSGWNLVGNPYPSTIDWDNANWTKTNVDNTIYFWNGTNYSYYKGTNGTNPSGAIFVNNGTKYIPPMQGYFVKAQPGTASSLTSGNAVRGYNKQAFYKSGETNSIRLLASHAGITDETVVYFANGLADIVDGNEDVWKLFSKVNSVPQIYTVMNGENLAINGMESPIGHEPVYLGFSCSDSGACSIKLTENTLTLSNQLYLEDLTENRIIDLNSQPEYLFVHHPKNNDQRFILHFTKPVSADESVLTGIIIYGSDGEIHIQTKGLTGNLDVNVYSVTGQLVYKTNLANDDVNVIKPNLESSVYIVKVISNQKTKTVKVYL